MTDAPRRTPAQRIEHAARDARRAVALRENLRRRKEQARARKPVADGPASDGPASDEPASDGPASDEPPT